MIKSTIKIVKVRGFKKLICLIWEKLETPLMLLSISKDSMKGINEIHIIMNTEINLYLGAIKKPQIPIIVGIAIKIE